MGINTNSHNTFTTASVLEHIKNFSAKLASTSDIGKLYEYCLSQTKNLFALDYTTLFFVDDSRKKLKIRATTGFSRDIMNNYVLKEGEGLPSLALRTRRVVTVEDFRCENRFAVTSIIRELDIRSAIAVPMLVSNKIFGVLIGHTLEKRKFSEDEQQIFQVLASQAAIALNNAIMITSLSESEQVRERKIRELQFEKEKTRELTNEFESIFSTITTGVLLLHKDRYLVRCNAKCAEIFGYSSAKELEGMSARKLHLSEKKYRDFGKKFYDNLVTGKTIQTEYMLKKRDGSQILCNLSGRAVDQSNPPDLSKGFVWLLEDITGRRELEMEILQARKLESIGVLAGGIGHDFNNILSAILGNLGLAQRLLDPEHDVQELLSSAVEAADKARELTEKLLLFTRRDTRGPGSSNIPSLFKEFQFDKVLSEQTDLQVNFQDGLLAARIMPSHLKVILQNLLVNADNCMPHGGRVIVSAYNVAVMKGDVPGLAEGKYVEISVADNGSGIEQDILDNIFDPYFTTKNRDYNKGIGLGLAIVHAIITKNHGSISVKPGEERGTIFTVLLPALFGDVFF